MSKRSSCLLNCLKLLSSFACILYFTISRSSEFIKDTKMFTLLKCCKYSIFHDGQSTKLQVMQAIRIVTKVSKSMPQCTLVATISTGQCHSSFQYTFGASSLFLKDAVKMSTLLKCCTKCECVQLWRLHWWNCALNTF